MIYVNLRGGNDGCGVVGDSLTQALQALTPVHRLDRQRPPAEPLSGPLLERIYRFAHTYTAPRIVAYCVFEEDERMRRVAMRAQGLFDVVAPASRWCEKALRDGGLNAVTTVHQGVDRRYFNPSRALKRRFRDRFVVFSGGKLELRKGQDVVVRAFRAFAQRHAEALLLASWQQPWTPHATTLAASPYYPFAPAATESPRAAIHRWLVDAGISRRQFELVPPHDHREMASIYGDSDVGVFPSRCEGGTNLVMMEYMACGRPAIATNFSGHRDILTTENCLLLQALRPLPILKHDELAACWCEPDSDELLESLERAYTSRHEMENIARVAAADLRTWTWDRAARQFLALLSGVSLPT